MGQTCVFYKKRCPWLIVNKKKEDKKNRLQKMHYIQVHLLKTLFVHRDTYRTLQRANVQRLIDSRMH